MLKLYALSPAPLELQLADLSSLDVVSHQLPQGLYSTFRTYAGKTKVLGLELHLARLYAPLAALSVSPAVSPLQLRAALRETLADFGAGEARVRITLATTEQAGAVFLALEPLHAPQEALYQRGVRVGLSLVERKTPRLKTTSFIGSSSGARALLQESGLYEALMVRNGRILEGLTSNFYAVRGATLITARAGILLGVTRRYVLRLARAQGLEIDFRPLRLEELTTIDEAFITSSGRGVLPVTEIEARPVGNGQVGQVARSLRAAYEAEVFRRADCI